MTLYDQNLNILRKNPAYIKESTNWLAGKLRKPDNKNFFISPDQLKIGSFYFMKYDSRSINKSSKMEQNVPLLLVDYKHEIDSRVLWVMNLNFLPMKIKTAFFSSLFNKNSDILEFNNNIDGVKEKTLRNINYSFMWGELIKYAFEYSIREIRAELIEKMLYISTDNIHYLTTISTQAMTGVDEAKLNQIWKAKLINEDFEDRAREILEIKSNYYKIIEELSEKFKDLDKRLGNI